MLGRVASRPSLWGEVTALALVSAQPGEKAAAGLARSDPLPHFRLRQVVRSRATAAPTVSRTRVLDFKAVSAEQIALIPHCASCGALWLPADEERWSAYLTVGVGMSAVRV